MKLLRNESDYRTWMIEDFYHLADDVNAIITPDELERELLQQMPESFPCIACAVPNTNPFEPAIVKFLSREQIAEWSVAMGIT